MRMVLLIRYLLLFLVFTWVVRKVKTLLTVRNESFSDRPSGSNNKKLSPYEVLEIQSNATPEEIRIAYKQALSKYHPDKVEHLGVELQKLAREKTHLITEAYNCLL